MAANLLSRGDVFAGRYRIERSIGTGGMGAVFEAEHVETERRVALKVLLPSSIVSETARDRFKQEARVAAKIRHPHIVDVLDAGVDDATHLPYLVMELLQGEDLGTRLDRGGPLAPAEAVVLLAQVASALDCLHERSIVHRDLKPDNLFLTWTDDHRRVMKLLDFGVAKVITDGSSSAFTQDAQGTPVYMAPEQFAEQIRISPATDIYALGMVAFAFLTGKHYWGVEIERGMNVFMLARVAEGGPKEAATVRARRQGAELPPAFDEWFSIVTALEPGERYPTAGTAVEVLADALGVPLVAPPPSSGRARVSASVAPTLTPPRLPSEQKEAADPVLSTPPIPLQRAYPFWRRPTTMTAALLAVVCVVAYGLLSVPGSPFRPSRPGASGATAGAAGAAAIPSSGATLPGTAAPAASPPGAPLSASTPTAASPSAPASATSPHASATSPTSPSVPPRTPKQPVPATTKKPKYTRE